MKEMSSSSRICVKNLPRNCTESLLRDTFSSRGEVTDVKLIYDKKTKAFRKFAFVGFRTADEATAAQKYFHNTFIGMSKIFVEVARKFTDSTLIEKKRKLQDMKQGESRKQQVEQHVSHGAGGGDAPQGIVTKNGNVSKKKEEFLQLMKRRTEAVTWGNDADLGDINADMEAAAADDDDDNVESGDDTKSGDSESKSVEDVQKVIDVGQMSDLDYLRSKTVRRDSLSDSDEEMEDLRDNHDIDQGTEPLEAQSQDKVEIDNINEDVDDNDNARLFLKNIPFTCTEDDLNELLSPFGTISELHMPIDSEYKRSKGYAFVEYLLPEHADAALEELSGVAFQGRVLYVVKAKAKQTSNEDGATVVLKGNAAKLSAFQRKKEEERRKTLNKREGWNAAHVRSDAVVETLAERHGVTAADILDVSKSGGDIAVNLAIGESQVILENKEYFAMHGVSIDALESSNSSAKAQRRSTTTLLVKNLPPRTDASELESMFARFGSLSAFIMPPSKTLALADFLEPSEARAAFKGLAYRSYKHSPLYLEWAPLNVINKNKLKKIKEKERKEPDPQHITEGKQNDDDDELYFASIFIKNISFNTTDQNLYDHILRLGAGDGLRTAVIRKKSKEKSGGGVITLSQGFGFAEYSTQSQATKACRLLHGSVLDSHSLEVKPSEKRLTSLPEAAVGKVKHSGNFSNNNDIATMAERADAKVIVRNVAFQATKAEIRNLFAAYSSVRRVRIPKKMNGEHRGFAFVDFSSTREAEAAIIALKNAHLYGRHLVIEWAKSDEDEQQHNNSDIALQQQRKKARLDVKSNTAIV